MLGSRGRRGGPPRCRPCRRRPQRRQQRRANWTLHSINALRMRQLSRRRLHEPPAVAPVSQAPQTPRQQRSPSGGPGRCARRRNRTSGGSTRQRPIRRNAPSSAASGRKWGVQADDAARPARRGRATTPAPWAQAVSGWGAETIMRVWFKLRPPSPANPTVRKTFDVLGPHGYRSPRERLCSTTVDRTNRWLGQDDGLCMSDKLATNTVFPHRRPRQPRCEGAKRSPEASMPTVAQTQETGYTITAHAAPPPPQCPHRRRSRRSRSARCRPESQRSARR